MGRLNNATQRKQNAPRIAIIFKIVFGICLRKGNAFSIMISPWDEPGILPRASVDTMPRRKTEGMPRTFAVVYD